MPKLAFFFGAGAEVVYGMPAGGRFALEIFRGSFESAAVTEFKRQRKAIKAGTYADWLPGNYESRPVRSFDKTEKRRVFQESLKLNGTTILDALNAFDASATSAIQSLGGSPASFQKSYHKKTGHTFGTPTYAHAIELNKTLGSGKSLFSALYFSAALTLSCPPHADDRLSVLIRAVVQLLAGALGQNIVNSLNEGIFTKRPPGIDALDEIGSLFKIDPAQAGQAAFDEVLSVVPEDITSASSLIDMTRSALLKVLEEIVVRTLSYQRLVDAYFGYLYDPKNEWTRFSKISTFLHSVRSYVVEAEATCLHSALPKSGAYEDVAKAVSAKSIEITGLGTSNYTTLLSNALSSPKTYHLNGSLKDFLDPYRNSIVDSSLVATSDRFLVPLMFTQSGIKPMTSVEMSRRYVEFYDAMKISDAIVVFGFGFNGDDGHINGMLRSAVDESAIRIIICVYHEAGAKPFKAAVAQREYAKKLRLQNSHLLSVVPVNGLRQSGKVSWLEAVLRQL